MSIELAQSLLGTFNQLWEDKYGKKYTGNSHADKWGFESMINDLGYMGAQNVVEYYFRLPKVGHPRQWLMYNYHTLYEQMEERAQQRRIDQEIRNRTRRMVEESK